MDEPTSYQWGTQAVIEFSMYRTRIGDVRIAICGPQLLGLAFADRWPQVERQLSRWFADRDIGEVTRPQHVADRLDAYMAGELGALDGIALRLAGTDFQRRVWTAIRGVPAGQVLTYAELARAVGAPKAVRAAGAACSANPLWLVVPCHRIVRIDGRSGDRGGRAGREQWLLAHERCHAR